MGATITIISKKVYGSNTARVGSVKYVYLLCAFLLFSWHTDLAQEKDSLAIYRKIHEVAGRHSLTKWVYDAVFVEPHEQEYSSEPAKGEGKIVNPYLKYKGRVIRKITITTFDPFGYSVNDTAKHKVNWLERSGNRLHVTTYSWVISNKLLFKEKDRLDPLELSESERLLRQAPYVNDARIRVKRVSKDTVDVFVFVQDKWSITIPGELTMNSANARFRDQNILGTGQQFEQYVGYKQPGLWNFNGFYNIANIDNTYISSRLGYQHGKDATQVSLSFDRPFYSPLANWAGGIAISHGQRFAAFADTVDNKEKNINLINVGYDAWYGRSIKLRRNGEIFNESNNLIVGARYYGSDYLKRPRVDLDVVKSFPNIRAYVGNVGFALQQYYKDKYIYRFGANEDVPEGLIVQWLYGITKTESLHAKYYTGIELARARHYDIGYLSATISYSVFFNRYITNDITNAYKLYYFSDLIRAGKWYIRQFVNGNLVYGTNKAPDEKLTLTSDDLYGFDGGTLRGNSKMVFQLQTVAYAPYNLVGFKFAPVLSAAIGLIGDDQQPLLNSNKYQGYSLGLLIRNENLLVSTFHISIGLYPFLPGRGSPMFKYNPIASFTLQVRPFAVSKPGFISY